MELVGSALDAVDVILHPHLGLLQETRTWTS